jgi:hypothetical protein
MSSNLEIMAAAVEHKPHSFRFIRKLTGLTMTDEEMTAMAKSNSGRFDLVRFVKRNDEGSRVRPGRLGVRLKKLRKA